MVKQTRLNVTFISTGRSESRFALRQRYVDLLVSIGVAAKVRSCFTYSVVKRRLKCNTGKACNCLIQFLLTVVLAIEERINRFSAEAIC
jgi:hypothetical protein